MHVENSDIDQFPTTFLLKYMQVKIRTKPSTKIKQFYTSRQFYIKTAKAIKPV